MLLLTLFEPNFNQQQKNKNINKITATNRNVNYKDNKNKTQIKWGLSQLTITWFYLQNLIFGPKNIKVV